MKTNTKEIQEHIKWCDAQISAVQAIRNSLTNIAYRAMQWQITHPGEYIDSWQNETGCEKTAKYFKVLVEQTRDKIEELENEEDSEIVAKVKAAIKEGKIHPAQEPMYTLAAQTDPEVVEKHLDSLPISYPQTNEQDTQNL